MDFTPSLLAVKLSAEHGQSEKVQMLRKLAGEIHTDFYNKFIRAEVVGYDDFISAGSFAKAKEQGTWRLEGKEYIVKDGDLMIIRHG
ncbi:MAG: DUF933 domain-containing protein [Ignavibacteriales bacterium]|nr:DUF933 domain-containing protein [Ignavibacteriales bacterium]